MALFSVPRCSPLGFLCASLFVSLICHQALASWVVPHHSQSSRTSSSSRQPFPFLSRRTDDATPTLCHYWIPKGSTNNENEQDHDETVKTSNLTPPPTTASTATRRQWMQGLSSAVAAAGAGLATFPQRTWGATGASAVAPPKLVLSPAVCDAAVSVWQRDGRLVYLLGTAHISSTSAQTAGDLVDDVRPKAVFVELDIKRVGGASSVLGNRLEGDDNADDGGSSNTQEVTTPDSVRWVIPQPNPNLLSSTSSQRVLIEEEGDDVDISSSSSSSSSPTKKKNKNPLNVRQQVLQAGAAAVGNSIKSMYQRLDQSGFSAGEEFVNAIREGQKIGSAIVLGDRDVEVTLRRLTLALSQTDLGSLFSPDNELEQSMRSLLPPPQARDIVEQGDAGALGLTDAAFKEELSTYVETLRTKENVRTIMKQLKRIAPALYQVMLAERDAYMAGGLDTLGQFQTIVAVMGMAHVDGVEQNLQELGWKPVTLNCKRYQ